ncbi:hypothetical protein ACOME3_010778, partial [Neoechinorhynchus agilis]
MLSNCHTPAGLLRSKFRESLTSVIKRRLVFFEESFLRIRRLAKEDSKQCVNEINCHRTSTRPLAE